MADREPSHYQRLGVTPAASTEEIRQAYRSLVARLHPDRQHGASPGDRAFAERRMREVNEAWRVLQDPTRRRAYDQGRRILGARPGPTTRPAGSAASEERPVARPVGEAARRRAEDDDDLVDVLPPMTAVQAGLFRHLPWVLVAVVLGGIFVLTAYAATDTDEPKPTPRQAAVGECLDVLTGTATTIVPCSGPFEFRVQSRVARVEDCPPGTEARRLGNDNLFDCLSPS